MKNKIIILVCILISILTSNIYAAEDSIDSWYSEISIGLGSTSSKVDIDSKRVIQTDITDDYWDQYSFDFIMPQAEENRNDLTATVLWPIIKGPVKVGVSGSFNQRMTSVGPFVGYEDNRFEVSAAYKQLRYDYSATLTDTVEAAWEGDPGLSINNQSYEPGTEVKASIADELKTGGISLRGTYKFNDNVKLVTSWTRTKETTMSPKVEYQINGEEVTSDFSKNEQVSKVKVDNSSIVYFGIAYSF
ncbi:hypothetical protein JCM16358_01340 [Halanaerocella petrolearia]